MAIEINKDDKRMKEIVLKWEGPFTFKDFLCNESNKTEYGCCGVYLWLEKSTNKVAYVGKARTRTKLYKRIWSHYIHLIGGAYMIPERYRTDQNQWDAGDSKEALQVFTDQVKFHELVDDGFWYMNHLRVCVAKLDELDVQDVERNLQYDLEPFQTKPGRVSKPPHKLRIHHTGKLIKRGKKMCPV